MIYARLVLDYLKVLAWPLVVLTGLLLLKDQLRSFIKRITHLSAAGVSAELELEAREIAADAISISENISGSNSGLTEPNGTGESVSVSGSAGETLPEYQNDFLVQTSFEDLSSSISYFEQIIRSWVQLEKLGELISEELDIPDISTSKGKYFRESPSASLRRVVSYLEGIGELTSGSSQVLQKIQKFRNELVHNPDEISAGTADSILRSIWVLRASLLRIERDIAGGRIGKQRLG